MATSAKYNMATKKEDLKVKVWKFNKKGDKHRWKTVIELVALQNPVTRKDEDGYNKNQFNTQWDITLHLTAE